MTVELWPADPGAQCMACSSTDLGKRTCMERHARITGMETDGLPMYPHVHIQCRACGHTFSTKYVVTPTTNEGAPE